MCVVQYVRLKWSALELQGSSIFVSGPEESAVSCAAQRTQR